ncbi:MAG: hypothetical protein ACR2HJ_00715 [Fimbriimonadales bacterium]
MRDGNNNPPPEPTASPDPLFDPLHEVPPVKSLGYEPRDFLGRRALIYFGLSHVIGLAIVLFLTYLLYIFFAERMPVLETSPLADDVRSEPVAPVLQPEPGIDMAKFKVSEQGRADHYGWVDKEKGIVHIPIERAIEITAQKGLPSRKRTKSEEDR